MTEKLLPPQVMSSLHKILFENNKRRSILKSSFSFHIQDSTSIAAVVDSKIATTGNNKSGHGNCNTKKMPLHLVFWNSTATTSIAGTALNER